MLTLDPTIPLAGVKLLILGMTEKLSELLTLPVGRVILIAPVVAPAGTTAVTEVALTNVGAPPETSLKATSVVSSRSVPLIVTSVPTKPLVGVKLLIVGEPLAVKG